MNSWRHYTVVFCFISLAGVALARVGVLHIQEREFLQAEGDARSVRSESIAAHRGMIFDRRGEPLAVSTPVQSIWMDPSTDQLRDDEVHSLALALELDAEKLADRIARSQGKEFLYLKRRIDPGILLRVKSLNLPELHFEDEYRRYYPAGETVAHVVGITNIDDVGLEGVELAFNDHLKSRPGKKKVLKDRSGNLVKPLGMISAPVIGEDISLSIDQRLQFFAYRELKAAVESRQAVSGSLVILDVESGEILAMVNRPSYNPNKFSSRGFGSMRNRAVTDTYEPGSTVKPLTVLAALETGRYQPTTVIDTTPGYFRVGNKLIEDPLNRGAISLTQVLEKSSQVGIAKIALDIDERAVFDVFSRAGFGAYIGTGLPGEVPGWLSDSQLKNPIVRTTLAYGYGLSISALQLAQGYLTLASGGVQRPVSIIKREANVTGVRVFSAKASRQVIEMMEGVVSIDGTAPKAQVPGYRVAGKTGTARKVGAQGYDDQRHVALFAGIAPVSDPRLVMVVVIDEPKGDAVGGGSVAAPIFSKVMARALRLLAITPDAPHGKLAKKTKKPVAKTAGVKNSSEQRSAV